MDSDARFTPFSEVVPDQLLVDEHVNVVLDSSLLMGLLQAFFNTLVACAT